MICKRRVAARLQALAQRLEIDGPVFLAHRLEHLDACDAVIGAALVAIVLQLDLDPVAQARRGDTVHGVVVLRLTDGQPRDPQPALPSRHIPRSRPSRSRSPAHDRRAARPSGRPCWHISGSAHVPDFPARCGTGRWNRSSCRPARAGRSRCRGRSDTGCSCGPASLLFDCSQKRSFS